MRVEQVRGRVGKAWRIVFVVGFVGALMGSAEAGMAQGTVQGASGAAAGQRRVAPVIPKGFRTCHRAVLTGDVKAGEWFRAEFTPGLEFVLEPLPSGWIARVAPAGKPWPPHDWAELATLPYKSVSPLLVSTDWAFRAQDAVGWNPRRFRFAEDAAAAGTLAGAYDGVIRGEAASARRAAEVAGAQPEGVLEIEDARLAPGLADQSRMAASVALRFAQTPHEVDQQALARGGSQLGRLEELRFRVTLELAGGRGGAKGVMVEGFPCLARPTTLSRGASEASSTK